MKQDLAKIFREMALLYELDDVAFKPRAYEHAADSLSALDQDIETRYHEGGLKALEEISGIGQGIAEKIEEYIKTGKIKEYLKLKKQLPVNIEELSRIEGLGPKTIKKLYDELRVKDLETLEAAVAKNKISKIPGLGAKTQDRILRSMQYLKGSHGRFLLGDIYPTALSILEKLRNVPTVKKAEIAGSFRRMQETIGDLDFLVISHKPEEVMGFFVHLPEVADVVAQGATKSAVRLKIGINADLRVVEPESFGAALQYFTGDKYHNIEVRKIAIDKGYKLNEYGLYKNDKIITSETEEAVYHKLGLAWMPPELRTNSGEIEAALHDNLPKLIDYDDLRGDLQVQTDWTDGEHSIEAMAQAAAKAGLEYITITDHTRSLAMTGGSDEKKLKQQMAEIDKVQHKLGSTIKILKGAEVNILKDGSLDIDNETLAELDIVGAAIHSLFNMSAEDMTQRMIKAIENPHVDIIFHPTGRIIRKREPYKIDISALIKAAQRTGTILEIDSYPSRLDLKDEHIRQAVEAGVKLSIDSDAHSAEHFQMLKFGIAQARRGWANKHDVINTRPWQQMLKLLK